MKKNDNSCSVDNEALIFQTEEQIFQIEASGSKLIISTFTNYYFINVFSKLVVKIGSKEKQGFYGSCFFNQDESKTKLFFNLNYFLDEFGIAGRSNGILWKVESASGKVLSSYKFNLEDGSKIK